MADCWQVKRIPWLSHSDDEMEIPEGWIPFAKDAIYLYLKRVEKVAY